MASADFAKHAGDAPPKKVIVVPGRLVNVVHLKMNARLLAPAGSTVAAPHGGAGRRLAAAARGCGFQLRQAPNFAFSSIYVASAPNSSLGRELKRSIASAGNMIGGQRCRPARTRRRWCWTCWATSARRWWSGLNASGQVREFQLRTRFTFKLRTPQGKELIPETELLQQRDISFNESAVLAKEAEENLLYRDMQTDIVQQLMRRLAAVKTI